ncbi:hypothetical protein NC651_006083 [Populus alba x Populus x berolinensis]|nr:hypothetical protein NC651_006083 [Populus alba x Populus x berolinensis]
MHYQQSPRVFVLQKPMVILLLVLFVSGDRKEETTVNVHGLQNQQPPSSTEKQQLLERLELRDVKGDFEGHLLDASTTILLIRLHLVNDGDVRGII